MRKHPVVLAGVALTLDIALFIIVAMLAVETTNFALVLFLAIVIYILGYDAFNAAVFLMEQFKK